MIGREFKRVSHELHNALMHTKTLGQMFLHMEYPEIILLRKKLISKLQEITMILLNCQIM